jgi:isopentenyl diphosphate isomerase/L-lactate dehydrogenase-like FMN-dependent dehydrogenase
MAAGQPGVERLLDLFEHDYRRTLELLGVRGTAELDRDLISVAN